MHPHPQALAMPPSTSPSAQAAALGQAGPHPHGAVLLQRLQSGPEGQGAAAGARGRVVSKEMIRKALLQLVVQDEFLEMLADAVSSQL